jgi:hypothetical protein
LGFPNVTRHQQDIGARGQVWEQTAFLDDVTNPAPKKVDIIGVDWLSAEVDPAGVRFDQTNDQPEQS